jgi:hypothetical protein
MDSEFYKLRLEINDLKKDMETVMRHEKKFNDSIDNLELASADLRTTITLFSQQMKELPSRVRALEDKSIITETLKIGGWFIVGAFVYAFANNLYEATKEKNQYSIQKNK